MMSRGKAEKKAARAARLSAALRENLKRRKAQARGRAQSQDVKQSQDSQGGAIARKGRRRGRSSRLSPQSGQRVMPGTTGILKFAHTSGASWQANVGIEGNWQRVVASVFGFEVLWI